MKPPSSVKVGPHKYRIVVVPHGSLGDAGRGGQAQLDRLIIAIDGDQPRSLIADVICHELTHTLLQVTDFDDDVKERICLAFGPGLLALLRDNPRLIDYLKETA